MTAEGWVGKDVGESHWPEVVLTLSGGIVENNKTGHHSQCPNWDSNRTLLEYNSKSYHYAKLLIYIFMMIGCLIFITYIHFLLWELCSFDSSLKLLLECTLAAILNDSVHWTLTRAGLDTLEMLKTFSPCWELNPDSLAVHRVIESYNLTPQMHRCMQFFVPTKWILVVTCEC
jgi:hypothetical protein